MATHRFGVSLLSKENYADAYNEEVMIDKHTGEVLIKTPDGDTISYNHNARLSSHITSARMDANNMGIYGEIVKVEFDGGVTCPFVMDYETNYIETPLSLPYNCKKLMIHIDIDPVTRNIDGFSYDRNNMLVEAIVALEYGDGTVSDPATLSYAMSKLNLKVFHMKDNSVITLDTSKQVSGIQLQSFKIKNTRMDYDDNVINMGTDVIRSICNSVFLIVET